MPINIQIDDSDGVCEGGRSGARLRLLPGGYQLPQSRGTGVGDRPDAPRDRMSGRRVFDIYAWRREIAKSRQYWSVEQFDLRRHVEESLHLSQLEIERLHNGTTRFCDSTHQD